MLAPLAFEFSFNRILEHLNFIVRTEEYWTHIHLAAEPIHHRRLSMKLCNSFVNLNFNMIINYCYCAMHKVNFAFGYSIIQTIVTIAVPRAYICT